MCHLLVCWRLGSHHWSWVNIPLEISPSIERGIYVMFQMQVNNYTYTEESNSRAWCKTIVTPYIKWGSNNSFAPSPRIVYDLQAEYRASNLTLFLSLLTTYFIWVFSSSFGKEKSIQILNDKLQVLVFTHLKRKTPASDFFGCSGV